MRGNEDYIVDEDCSRMLLVSFVGTLIIGTPLIYLLSPMIENLGFGSDLPLYVAVMYIAIFTSLFYLQFRVLTSRYQTQEQPIMA
ncbi:MAG: hypothetical protein ACFFAY_00465 [Promethearchaeota archaeon]